MSKMKKKTMRSRHNCNFVASLDAFFHILVPRVLLQVAIQELTIALHLLGAVVRRI